VAAAFAAKHGFTVAPGGFVAVGTPVCPSGRPAYAEAYVAETAERIGAGIAALAATLDTPGFEQTPKLQAVLRAVRMTGTPSIFHLLRALTTTVIRAAAADLDRRVFSVVMDACGIEPPSADTRKGKAVRKQFTLATEMAGLSFASAADVSAPAYLCGVLNAANVLTRIDSSFDAAAAYPDAAAIFAADRELRHSPLAHLSTFEEAVREGGGGGLQAAITKGGQRRALVELYRGAASDAEKRAFIGNSGKGGCWQSANPCMVPISDGVVDAVCRTLHMPVCPAGDIAESICLRCGALQPATGEHADVCHHSTALQERAACHAVAFVNAMKGTGVRVFRGQVGVNGKTTSPL
jgi:hypothetical protein